MKLSDYIIEVFVKRGTRHFFVMTGGAAAHRPRQRPRAARELALGGVLAQPLRGG